MYMNVVPACTYMYRMHATYLQRPEEAIKHIGVGAAGNCELLSGHQEQGSRHVQQVLLAVEPSFPASFLWFEIQCGDVTGCPVNSKIPGLESQGI